MEKGSSNSSIPFISLVEMETALQLHRPLGWTGDAMGSCRFRTRPTIGVLSNSLASKCIMTLRITAPLNANSGKLLCCDSGHSRRQPRRSAVSKSNVSAAKGFPPKPQAGRSTQKQDHDPQELQSSNRFSDASAVNKDGSSNFGSASTLSGNLVKRRTKLLEGSEKSVQDVDDIDLIVKLSKDEDERDETKVRNEMESSVVTVNHTAALNIKEEEEEVMVVTDVNTCQNDRRDALHDESQAKKRTEMEAHARRELLEHIAKEKIANRDNFFVFPKIIKADNAIEVFFNRSLSLLVNETNIFIKGAFNDWRWKDFTEKMHKCDLQGDWWTCQIYVPKQAYKIDFVFFNGGNVYDNNNMKDFSHSVEGEMDVYAFENFVVEEERRRLEKLAAEQAERERQAEEQRRRDIEQKAMEVDRAQAKLEAEKRCKACQSVMALAVDSVDGLWHKEHILFDGENKLKLCYNRSSRPLNCSSNIWIHGGYNNWIEGLSIVERLKKCEEEDGDWWYVDVVVPDKALVLDWVFADGPPQQANVYDNNNHQDFHTIITENFSDEIYWAEEENRLFWKLREERRLTEEAARKKAEKMIRLKADTKERTLKRFLLSQKDVVYTEPLVIPAGKTVRIFYNPTNTVLNGKKEVWFRCSFNRWTHHNGALPPQKMVTADNNTHLQAIVQVPLDAYVMDFVFSEREDGGVYDNNTGTDYHIPVIGGSAREAPLHIIHVAVEMAPVAKVGGLGDVVTSLSRAVQDLGHKIDVIFPKYDCLNHNHVKEFHYHLTFVWGRTEIKVWHGKVEGLSVYFLEPQNGMFSVGCVYGRNNDGDRFSFFCHAALEFLLQSGFCPDIVHCHDWSSAPVAWLFKEHYKHQKLANARIIFTIHNLEFGIHQIGKAMIYTDKATTVSHTYSKEISKNPAISPHLYKFHGIVNGIDPDIWDPFNDKFIPVSYTSENSVEGKKAAKEALQQRLGLKKSDHPLVGIITRLTVQKGIHLIKHAIWRTLERNGQVVLLGSAPDPRIQNDFAALANQLHSSHSDRARLCLTYDEPLSHLIYAGADFILVPSIFEPCGLTQLVAMRYGSIPVVRKTGGLYDTVFDVDNDKERAQSLGLEPNGFNFEGTNSSGVDYALNRAISAWYDNREWFNLLCKRVMEQDWSWNRPALDYLELYHAARK